MAEDRKFFWDEGLQCFRNRINGAPIPHDEPVIIFRARDVHALNTLWFYLSQVQDDHHKQAVRDRIAEFSAFKASEEARMKEPGITHDIRLNDEVQPVPGIYEKMTETLYMEPVARDTYMETMWNSFSDEQKLHLIQNAKASNEAMPSWMVAPDTRPVCSEDGCYRREDCGPACRNRN